jgi:hypothetical protein
VRVDGDESPGRPEDGDEGDVRKEKVQDKPWLNPFISPRLGSLADRARKSAGRGSFAKNESN